MARVQCGRGTQFDNFVNLMCELALECVWSEQGEGLLRLFPEGSEYFERVQRKLDRIRRRGGSKLPKVVRAGIASQSRAGLVHHTPSNCWARESAWGEPRPVTRSYPLAAE